MKGKKISIITSAYNAESTLNKTIRSVLNQTWYNFEYIIVDHGSTDGTKKIIDEFAQQDSRICPLYIEKNTGCIGKALNYALKFAKGDYICFLDADDWLESDYMSCLKNSIDKENADVAICGFRIIDQYNREIQSFVHDKCCILKTEDEWLNFYTPYLKKQMILSLTLLDVWWNKLYRKEFLDKNNLYFYETTNVLNDSHFNYDVFSLYPKTVILNKIGINYYRQANATVFTYKLGEYIGRIEYVQRWNKFLSNLEEDKSFYADGLFCAFYMINTAKTSVSEKFIELSNWVSHPVFLQYYICKKLYANVSVALELTIRLIAGKDRQEIKDNKNLITSYYDSIICNSYSQENFENILDILFRDDNYFSLGSQWIADYIIF